MASRRSLDSLKVNELKNELDLRKEDTSGLKTALATRLMEVLKREGKDPENFEMNSAQEEKMENNNPKEKAEHKSDTPKEKPKGDETKDKAIDENSSLIVHVGDATDDLDYDITGKRESEEENKGAPNTSEQSEGDNKANSKNLWVANMPKSVKAAELRSHFSKAGKVLAARVFLNKAQGAQSKCYGLVQMATVEDADRCIKELNRTMLAGQRIYVDKAKSDLNYAATKRPASTNASNPAKKAATTAVGVSAPAASSTTSSQNDKKDAAKKDSIKVGSLKKDKVEVKKESDKKSTSTSVKEKSESSDSKHKTEREKEKLEMVKRKEEDLEKLKQRQLQLAKTQRLEFDRLAREKEKLRHEREEIERERRNLRRIRKEVEVKATEREEPSHRSGEDRYNRDERRRSPEPSASSRGRVDRAPRYQGSVRDSKPYSRPSAPSGSERRTTNRYYENESRSSRPERDSDYRRQEERQENRYDNGGFASSRNEMNSGYRHNEYGGESSRMRSRGYEQENRQTRGAYEQSTSKYKKEASSSSYTNRDTYDNYSRDYNSYNSDSRRQPAASYYKDFNTIRHPNDAPK